MNLSVKVVDKNIQEQYGVLSVKGQIQMDLYKENFYMPLESWKIVDYEKQWSNGIERLKKHNQSCLVTRIYDPNVDPFIEWWVIHKVDNVLYIQNQIIFSDIYRERIGDKAFTIESCYDFIQPRKIYNYEGKKISEWQVLV